MDDQLLTAVDSFEMDKTSVADPVKVIVHQAYLFF